MPLFGALALAGGVWSVPVAVTPAPTAVPTFLYPNNKPHHSRVVVPLRDGIPIVYKPSTLPLDMENRSLHICPVGQYRSNPEKVATGWESCVLCPAGKYNHFRDALFCFDCGRKYYADRAGARRCNACPDGKYGDSSRTHCIDMEVPTPSPVPESWGNCPAGHYNKVLDSGSYCLSCPYGAHLVT